MANTINAETLKAWRQKRGWTQKQLADRLKCSSDQVSRWERGKSQNVRSHLRKALTKSFGVEWEELTKFPKESGKTADNIFNVQLNVRVRHWERTALQLVGDYYRIPIANIVGLSPLLFLIIAEKSLAHRRAAISEITSMQDKTETEGIRIAPHLKSDLGASHIVADSVIYSEKTSIEKRDLFGDLVELEWVSDPDGEGLNPFANYLKRLSEEIPDGMATELSADWGSDHIYYSLLEEVLREKFGLIADEGSDDQTYVVLHQILNGSISLKKALAKREILSEQEFNDWLLAESGKVPPELPIADLIRRLSAGDIDDLVESLGSEDGAES